MRLNYGNSWAKARTSHDRIHIVDPVNKKFTLCGAEVDLSHIWDGYQTQANADICKGCINRRRAKGIIYTSQCPHCKGTGLKE